MGGHREAADDEVEREAVVDDVVWEVLGVLMVGLTRYHRSLAARMGIEEPDLIALEVLVHLGEASVLLLAERVGLGPAAGSRMAGRLERAGWVTRAEHGGYDGRQTVVRLTPGTGGRLIEVRRRLADRLAVTARDLSATDRDTVVRWLSRVGAVVGLEANEPR